MRARHGFALASLALCVPLLACGGDDSTETPATSGGSGQSGAGSGGKSGGSGQSGAAGSKAGSGGQAGGGQAGGGQAGQAGGGQAGQAGGGQAGQAGGGQAGQAGGGQAGGGMAGAGMSGGSGQAGGGQAGSGGGGPLSCSEDLSAVLDGSGAVVQVCPDDQGCKGGACVPLCEAADAAGSNLGCEFWVSTPRTIGTKYATPSLQPCFAVLLANTTKQPAKVQVELGGASFDATTFGRLPAAGKEPKDWPALPPEGIPADQVAVLFLSHDPAVIFQETQLSLACPVATATGASGVEGNGLGEGFRIATDVPVSAYDIFPFGGARSHFPGAQLLFPRAATGTNYVLVGPPRGTSTVPGPAFLQILAVEDNTQVTLAPTEALPASGAIPAIAAGSKATFSLDAGQYAQWEIEGGTLDLAGSILESDRKVSVSVGNRFLRLQPVDGPGGEATHNAQQPASSLGFSYVAAPYETRRADLQPEEIQYRLVGAVDGTTLAYDPPVDGAPAQLGKGQVADFKTTLAFKVKSQDADHPFGFAQMMMTANVPGGSREGGLVPYMSPPYPLGDEEFVPLLPPVQFRSAYVFMTDTTYATTNLTVIREQGASGFEDVEVECLGKLSGWKAVGSDGTHQYTTVDLLRAGKPSGTCQNGRQYASSKGPFGLIVWGLDTYSSYGYPAGGNARKTTEAVIKP